MDLDVLSKKIKGVSTNIAIYTDHLKKQKKELSEDFSLDVGKADDRLHQINKKVKQLKRQKDKLYYDAQKILKGIKDNVD